MAIMLIKDILINLKSCTLHQTPSINKYNAVKWMYP